VALALLGLASYLMLRSEIGMYRTIILTFLTLSLYAWCIPTFILDQEDRSFVLKLLGKLRYRYVNGKVRAS